MRNRARPWQGVVRVIVGLLILGAMVLAVVADLSYGWQWMARLVTMTAGACYAYAWFSRQ